MFNLDRFKTVKKEDEKDGAGDAPKKEEVAAGIDFFTAHARAIEDYAESGGIIFRQGARWAINMEKGEATYDPKFFTEKGYADAEAMWATCHEVEHFRDWRRDPEIYARLFARMKTRRRIHVLYNCIDDIMVNRNVDKRFPAHRKTKERLYREKLFPGMDYADQPKHLQFAYACLREKMLPEEILNIAPAARAAIDKLKNIDGQGTDLISLVSDPQAEPKDRFEIIRDYIEPIYEKFFQEDVEERKKRKKSKEGGKGEKEEGEPQAAEDYFKDEYDDFDSKSPEAIPIKDIKDALEKGVKRRKAEKSETPDKKAVEQFEAEHGVSFREMENYRADYEKIKRHIEPLRRIFERIISKRKEIKRRLKERTDQGVVLEPSLAAQAYIDARSGVLDSRTQLKIRKEERDENKPNNFEFTLICDLSNSMDENNPGGKSYEQRMCAILIMEALSEFENKLKEERLEKSLDLHIFTETRGFGNADEELKPLSDEIDYKTRINIAKRLARCEGSNTRDFLTLEKIDDNLEKEKVAKIKNNDLKKVVLLITDGGSDDTRKALKEKKALEDAGIIIKAIQVGSPSGSDIEKFKIVWGGDGRKCPNVEQLVPAVEKLLEDFLEDL